METEVESRATAAPRAGFRLLPHQRKIAADVLADLRAGKDEVLLAACPGFGKTEVAIWLIRELLREGKVKRVLVLPHGTKVLLDNFKDRLNLRAPGLLSSGKVVAVLPHSAGKIAGRFDLVVSDESHDFYEVEDGMVERIIKRVAAKQTLLLTGTPSPFIRRGLKPHAFALRELISCGRASDVEVVLASSAWRAGEADWNVRGELLDSVKLSRRATEKTLDDLLVDLRERVDVATAKTIIACRDVAMANQVSAALTRRYSIDHLVSEHTNDNGSTNVRAFRLGPCPVLVVVNRATLGFDMPELANFIDMTGSRNPDRIFQMCCRLVRQPGNGAAPQKLFVKVMPPVFSGEELQHFMTGVMMLGDHEVYTTWKGRPLNALSVGVRKGRSELGDAAVSKPLLAREMMSFGNLFTAMEGLGFATTTLGSVLGGKTSSLEIEINGRIQSATAWAKEVGISDETIRVRWHDGLRGDALLMQPACRDLKVKIEGTTRTPKAWAAVAGITENAFRIRLRSGVRGKALLAPSARPRAGLAIKIGNRTLSVRQWAARSGVGEGVIYRRYHAGVRGPDLIAPPVSNELRIRIGNRTQSATAWGRESGIPAGTIWLRYRQGVSGPALLSAGRVRR